MHRRRRESQATADALQRMAHADGVPPAAAIQNPQNPIIRSPRNIQNTRETMLNGAATPIATAASPIAAEPTTDAATASPAIAAADDVMIADEPMDGDGIPLANNEMMPPLPPISPPVNDAQVYTLHDEWAMPRHETYEYFLRPFFQYVHRRDGPYPKGTTFSKGQFSDSFCQQIVLSHAAVQRRGAWRSSRHAIDSYLRDAESRARGRDGAEIRRSRRLSLHPDRVCASCGCYPCRGDGTRGDWMTPGYRDFGGRQEPRVRSGSA